MKSKTTICVIAIALSGVLGACQAPRADSPKPTVRMTMIPNGRDPVLEIFSKQMADVEFVRVESPGGVTHVDYLEQGLADASMVQADVAYTAFTKGTATRPEPHRTLRAMAVASVNAMHLITAPGTEVRSLQDLRGLRIGADRPGTNTELTIRSLFPRLGIPVSDMHLEQSPSADIPVQLANGTLDAALILTRFPASMVQNAISVEGTQLASIPASEIRQLREQYPFFRQVTIPAGTYGQAEDIATVGISMVLVCREDLSEAIVYDMLNAFFASLPELADRQPGYRGVTMDQAPATPIPLHPGAARFYRERQLFR